jgi:hypothetical protein
VGACLSLLVFQFTSFTSTKVQILTPEELKALYDSRDRECGADSQFTCFTSTIVQILTREASDDSQDWQYGADEYGTQILSLLALLVQKYKY